MDQQNQEYIAKHIQIYDDFDQVPYKVDRSRFSKLKFKSNEDIYSWILDRAHAVELNINHMATSDFSSLYTYFTQPLAIVIVNQEPYYLDLKNTGYDYSRW